MGIFYDNMTLSSTLTLIVFIAGWIFINEITRKSKSLSVVFYVVLPIVLAGLILSDVLYSPTGKTWFGWVKVISALIGVYGFMLIRFTKLGQTKFASIFPISILAINISEAVYRELQIYMTYTTMQVDAGGVVVLGGTWNILNAIAGVLTIVTLTGWVGIKASKDESKDMIWPDMTWMYIIGYTLWNFAYVYNCISTRSMYAGFAILIAAIISELVFKQGAWLQHRAQILSLYAMFSLSLDYQKWEVFQIVPTYNETMWMAISVISFVFNVGVFIHMIYTIRRTKRNPMKEELYVDTNYYKKTIRDNNLSKKRRII